MSKKCKLIDGIHCNRIQRLCLNLFGDPYRDHVIELQKQRDEFYKDSVTAERQLNDWEVLTSLGRVFKPKVNIGDKIYVVINTPTNEISDIISNVFKSRVVSKYREEDKLSSTCIEFTVAGFLWFKAGKVIVLSNPDSDLMEEDFCIAYNAKNWFTTSSEAAEYIMNSDLTNANLCVVKNSSIHDILLKTINT